MVLAMVIGMAALGAVVWGAFGLLGHANLSHYAGVRAFVMTTNMTIGMALWMRYRRHSTRAIAEMAGAMFVPYVVLIGPFWTELLSPQAFLVVMHALMIPCMIVAMLRRREEYTTSQELIGPIQGQPKVERPRGFAGVRCGTRIGRSFYLPPLAHGFAHEKLATQADGTARAGRSDEQIVPSGYASGLTDMV